MKTANAETATGKGRGETARAMAAKPARPAAAKRKPSRAPSSDSGYGDTAAQFIARGKAAFADAWSWAGETGSALPRAARNVSLPDQRAVQDYVSDRPLILGAVGLGLGLAIGVMLPNAAAPEARKPRRK